MCFLCSSLSLRSEHVLLVVVVVEVFLGCFKFQQQAKSISEMDLLRDFDMTPH